MCPVASPQISVRGRGEMSGVSFMIRSLFLNTPPAGCFVNIVSAVSDEPKQAAAEACGPQADFQGSRLHSRFCGLWQADNRWTRSPGEC